MRDVWRLNEWERLQWGLKDYVGGLLDELNDLTDQLTKALSDLSESDARVTQLEAENDHLAEQLRAAEMGESNG